MANATKNRASFRGMFMAVACLWFLLLSTVADRLATAYRRMLKIAVFAGSYSQPDETLVRPFIASDVFEHAKKLEALAGSILMP